MFKVIPPEHHCFYASLLKHFVDLIEFYSFMEFTESEKNNATFIITQNKEKGICGGAMLFKRKLNELPQNFSNRIAPFVLPEAAIWQCTIYLHFENENPLFTAAEDELFCNEFYPELYEKLREFGERKEIGFLCLCLDAGEYLCTEENGWPYLFELRPSESPDGLFYGALPLVGRQYEAYRKAQQQNEIAPLRKKRESEDFS